MATCVYTLMGAVLLSFAIAAVSSLAAAPANKMKTEHVVSESRGSGLVEKAAHKSLRSSLDGFGDESNYGDFGQDNGLDSDAMNNMMKRFMRVGRSGYYRTPSDWMSNGLESYQMSHGRGGPDEWNGFEQEPFLEKRFMRVGKRFMRVGK